MKSKNLLLKFISITMIICISLLSLNKVFANTNIKNTIKEAEYSDAYKHWLSLSEEERQNTLEPLKYDIVPYESNKEYLKSMNNVFKANTLLKNSLDTRFSLKDIIPENIIVKDQMQTNTCWTFASLGSLETNLALQDKLHGNDIKVYDFSERHMAYSILRDSFLNGEINEFGYSRKVSDGGNALMANAYLTNGIGAVNEEDLPFENNQDDIDISEIQNKEVQTTVFDAQYFLNPTTEEKRLELIDEMKQYISNYGGLYAGIYGASLFNETYNNATGAIYCDNAVNTPINHAVTIIGWDDDYDVSNFKEGKRPSSNGAWIAKNSWGEKITYPLSQIQEEVYSANQEMMQQAGYNSPEEIPNEVLIAGFEPSYGEGKVIIDGDNINFIVGDNGLVYISYEDANVYTQLYGIKNAVNKKDYDNLYQVDPLGLTKVITFSNSEDVYLVNTFKRDTQEQEKLDKISITSFYGYECEVYVNPNGKEKTQDKLQKVELQDGDTTIIEPLYSTIEFAKPIDLTGEYFTVAVKIISDAPIKYIGLESQADEPTATVNAEESFVGGEQSPIADDWVDIGAGTNGLSGNLCIKAFTTDTVLETISITSNPTKTTYKEGENFDKTGLKVVANYSDGTSLEIIDYSIVDGQDLKLGQTSVTISYSEGNITKTVTIPITVEENPDKEPGEEPGENPGEDSDNKPSEEENPTPSNFSSADGKITDTELYIYTDNSNEGYTKFKIRISNIKMGDSDNDYTYYYYLSSIQGETNIDDNMWNRVDIYNNNNGTITLEINVNTKDMEIYDELVESDNLFIYIKEVAKLGQKETETINTLPLTKISEDKIYVNGELLNNDDTEKPNRNQNNNQNNKPNDNQNKIDDTTAPGVLPQTGTLPIIIIAIGLVAVGVISYHRFKNIDK